MASCSVYEKVPAGAFPLAGQFEDGSLVKVLRSSGACEAHTGEVLLAASCGTLSEFMDETGRQLTEKGGKVRVFSYKNTVPSRDDIVELYFVGNRVDDSRVEWTAHKLSVHNEVKVPE